MFKEICFCCVGQFSVLTFLTISTYHIFNVLQLSFKILGIIFILDFEVELRNDHIAVWILQVCIAIDVGLNQLQQSADVDVCVKGDSVCIEMIRFELTVKFNTVNATIPDS